jgi:hypothetical protein
MNPQAREHARRAGEHGERAAEHGKEAIGETGQAASAQARATADKARHTAEHAREQLKQGEEFVREKSKQMGDQLREGVDRVRHTVEPALRQGEEVVRAAGHKLEEAGERLAQDVRKMQFKSIFGRWFTNFRREKLPVQLWIITLILWNYALPLIYYDKYEAQMTLGANVAASILMVGIYWLTGGYTRLLGLAHVTWIPLMYWLWIRSVAIETLIPQLHQGGPPGKTAAGSDLWLFDKWIISLLVLNSLSLVVDAIDVVRYARGERGDRTVGRGGLGVTPAAKKTE